MPDMDFRSNGRVVMRLCYVFLYRAVPRSNTERCNARLASGLRVITCRDCQYEAGLLYKANQSKQETGAGAVSFGDRRCAAGPSTISHSRSPGARGERSQGQDNEKVPPRT